MAGAVIMAQLGARLIAYYDTRYVTGRFGDPRPGGRIHEGTDFSHSRTPGLTPVPALLDGTVTKVWVVSSFHGYGNRVDTATARGEISYAHLHARSQFRVGDRVLQGATVGHEGMSGFVSGSCCHIEHAVGGRKRDPLPLIRDVLATQTGTPAGEATEPEEEEDMARLDIIRISDSGWKGVTLALAPEHKMVAADAAQAEAWAADNGGLKDRSLSQLGSIFDSYAIPRNLMEADMLACWTRAGDVLRTVTDPRPAV